MLATVNARRLLIVVCVACLPAAAAQTNSLDAADGTPEMAVFVDPDGSVGVGTPTPLAKLHVAGTSRFDGDFNVRSPLNFEPSSDAPTLGGVSRLLFEPAQADSHTSPRQGVLSIFADDGATATVRIQSGHQSAPPVATGGSVRTYYPDGSILSHLGDYPNTGGVLHLHDRLGELRYRAGADGTATLYNAAGAGTIVLDGDTESSRVASIFLYNSTGSAQTFRLDAGESDGGDSQINMYNGNAKLTVQIDADVSGDSGGWVGLYDGNGDKRIELDGMDSNGDGRITADVIQINGGGDLSERFDISSCAGEPQPGMVVVIDEHNPGGLCLGFQPYDRRVAGVVSGAGGIRPGVLLGQQGTIVDGAHPVALSGRVYVWVDADMAPVRAGDFLTTSSTPGYAMCVADYDAARGAILGKAMTGLERGKGLVLALVTLQ